ncbi:ABC transporter substrate-binding protein [Variovorax sp. PCZ-1]|uniref:ABC transporter substrate-binding protein n=1 Tax=Variovorax sp. PCZ-1 TaxID=2835533 RepID=UPI001BD16265|nr:ABC transporter substrate-binding protein [Variovorax sp. PCZ-1]MBS7807447.1 ABC transporter substrate-binding protein [Variovorax sp. PCZ-1]
MNLLISRRQTLFSTAALLASSRAWAQSPAWAEIEKKARGQTVVFNAWGGSERINAYLAWAGDELQKQFGVKLEHVKVTDTSDVVKRVRNEKAAGRNVDGSVDLIWINGENFLAMKREAMLFGPWAESLPSFRFVDVEGKPTTRIDFAEPVQGLEAPWGMAQLTFYADRAKVPNPPRSTAALLAFAKANPGRVTYPKPPQFHGTTFLKQTLMDLTADRAPLYKPFDAAAFAKITEPLWKHLDALHPHLWRGGKQFPVSHGALNQMLADGELSLSFTFNPNEPANEIAAGRLPKSVSSYQFDSGTVGNTHFLAIPFNSKVKEGSQVVANFLLSPAAQARKADIKVWGDPTVLSPAKMSATDAALFTASRAPGQVEKFSPVIPEPHGSWVDPMEKEWLRRYGA